MNCTPNFPQFNHFLAPMKSRFKFLGKELTSMAFNQLELHFAHFIFIPRSLFPKNAQKQNSRDRVYNQPITFWGFLWQTLTPQTSCREVVRQVQSLFKLHRQDSLSHGSAAFCKARKRLHMDTLTKALDRTAILAQPRGLSQDSSKKQGNQFPHDPYGRIVLPQKRGDVERRIR